MFALFTSKRVGATQKQNMENMKSHDENEERKKHHHQ